MAHSREKGGRVVFIGNIPYGQYNDPEHAHETATDNQLQVSAKSRSARSLVAPDR